MSKVINLNEWRQQKQTETETAPIPGFVVWLHCPTCQTTEYTEVQMSGGRTHKCGTRVEEVEVAIDVRAEYTISQWNLTLLEENNSSNTRKKSKLVNKLLGITEPLIQQIKNNVLEYQRRLQLMTSEKLTPYSDDWSPEKNGIHVTAVQPLGIMLTSARQADKHFPQKK